MALTDKQKKKIISDYIDTQNYSETARLNNVSDKTVKRICSKEDNNELVKKVEEKKEQNTKEVMQTLDDMQMTRKELLTNVLKAMNEKAQNVDTFTNIKDLSTAYGIIFDKELKFKEIKQKEEELKREEEAKKEKFLLPARVLAKSFVDVNRWIDDHKYTDYWLYGGRGSLKSSFVSEKFIDLIKNNSSCCGLILRKVKDTLKDSVFSQIIWAIEMLGLSDEFVCTSSPMQIKRKSTGQIIYFRGADDPGKIKSIKPPKGMYIGVIWYEEFDQFSGMEEVRKIDQSVMRGGEVFWNIKTYNTPRSREHWVNKEVLNKKDARLLHCSDYRDVPIEWIGHPFVMEAEYLKEIDEDSYKHEYLGEAVGSGGNVFNRLEIREISDEEIDEYEYFYQGIDWGWFPDPTVWVRMSYDSSKEEIYIFDEIYKNKLPNEDLGKKILERAPDENIYCDNSENKSINDLKGMGLIARAVTKGPGSVEYGIKWLARRKIIIDPTRCPNTAKEFSTYELEKNKDGEFISGYPDKNNHSIDATRYALSRVISYRGNSA